MAARECSPPLPELDDIEVPVQAEDDEDDISDEEAMDEPCLCLFCSQVLVRSCITPSGRQMSEMTLECNFGSHPSTAITNSHLSTLRNSTRI